MNQKNSDLLGTRYLYHGTSAAAWQAIRHHGALLPRGENSGNWSHTVRSHEGAVYLTSAYGLYFAACASGEGSEGAVLQIDVDALAAPQLCCDEDAYALLDLKRANPGKPVAELVQRAKEALATCRRRIRSRELEPQSPVDACGTRRRHIAASLPIRGVVLPTADSVVVQSVNSRSKRERPMDT